MADNGITGIPQVDARILEIRDRQRDDVIPPPRPLAQTLPEIRDLRRRLRTQLEPIFAQAGPEVDSIKRILTEYQRDLQTIVSARRSRSSAEPLTQSKNRPSHAIKPADGNYLITAVLVEDASLIYANPLEMLQSSVLDQNNNQAVLYYRSDFETPRSVSWVGFYYYWTFEPPDSDLPVVQMNISTSLWLDGYLAALANQMWFQFGSAYIGAWPSLTVFVPGQTDPNFEATGLLGYARDDGMFFGGDGSQFDFDSTNNVNFNLTVPANDIYPGDIIVFEVALTFVTDTDGGWATLNLDDLVSYGVVIEIMQSLF
jgi:hypothetical protein